MGKKEQDVLKLSIQSSYACMERVATLVEKAAVRIGISEDNSVDLMIAITEAVTNAIQHGNREDESKRVHIRVETAPSEITIWVEDEGKGFDVEAVQDPRNTGNLLRESGRGILMMQAFMDEVAFASGEKGTSVRMVKRFASDME